MDEIAADEILAKLDRIAERRIQEAIDAGEFDNLEGMGKPLTIEDNPFVPKELKAAFKVLENSGYAPDWMTVGQQIEGDLARIRATADHHFASLRASMAELAGNPLALKRMRTELTRLKARHARAAKQHHNSLVELNRKINLFNQMTPIASLYRVPLSVEREMERFEERVPAYLSYV